LALLAAFASSASFLVHLISHIRLDSNTGLISHIVLIGINVIVVSLQFEIETMQ
jgi:hypothetical protein